MTETLQMTRDLGSNTWKRVDRPRIVRLWNEGMSVTQIAESEECHTQTVYRVLRDARARYGIRQEE